MILISATRPWATIQRRSGLHGPGVRGARRRADRAGRAQRRGQDHADANFGRPGSARLRQSVRPARDSRSPVAAGARFPARPDADRRRQAGLASLLDLQHELEEAAQEMAEAEDEDRSRPRRTPIRRIARAHRASGCIFDRASGRGGADGAGVRRIPVPPRRVAVLRRPAVADDARQAAVAEPRSDAPGRAFEPPRHRHDRMARELPGAPAGRRCWW